MASEKRLIDANAIEVKIEKSFKKLIANQNRPDLAAALSYVGDLIIEAPTVDAVEVVRCKDCKHATINERHPNKPLICGLTRMCGTTPPEWYCADGERKDNG